MKNNSLKSRFLTLIVAIFLISSCDTKQESSTNNAQTTYRLSNEDIAAVAKAIKTKDDEVQSKSNTLASKTFTEIGPNPELPYEEYQDLLAGKNLSVQIDERTVHILDQSYEENIQYLSDLHIFNTNEIAAVTVFKDELINTQNFSTSILHFENAILLLPMTNKKLQRFYNFIDALKAMNSFDPYYFNGGSITAKSGGLFGSCLSASIGVGFAFVGLVSIEVGSFGFLTGVAVGGFIWASAEWAAACKGNGKKLYPAKIIKPYKKVESTFITLDDNGDVTEGPITLFLTPSL